MLLTEEEAKTKWCPFVSHGVVARERATKDEEPAANSSRCIGSACMAWRETGFKKCRDRRGNLVDRDIDGTGQWLAEGYCGLAGKVEP